MKQEQRVREAQELIALASDRERIARDLHDNVVQDLFGAALGLQSIAMRVEDAGVRSRTLEIVDHVDNVIREIRTTIFAMTAHRDGTGTLQDRLLATIDEASRALRFRPSFRSHGPVDTATSEHIAEQLLPTLREALANVTRHAHATNADIDLSFDGGMLTLTVADNGIGLPEQQASPGHGLRNMGDRAADLGGTMTLANNGDQGTILTWRVPSPTHPLPA